MGIEPRGAMASAAGVPARLAGGGGVGGEPGGGCLAAVKACAHEGGESMIVDVSFSPSLMVGFLKLAGFPFPCLGPQLPLPRGSLYRRTKDYSGTAV